MNIYFDVKSQTTELKSNNGFLFHEIIKLD
jgi:hypothetical protein